ncbi:MAG: exodeoxyribonuclease VII small subunit [Leptospirales bacterium]
MSKSVKNLTFEEAMNELEEITKALEAGEDSLEKSMELYEKAVSLRQFCEEKLTEAEGKWTVLKKKPDGNTEAEKVDKETLEEGEATQGSIF